MQHYIQHYIPPTPPRLGGPLGSLWALGGALRPLGPGVGGALGGWGVHPARHAEARSGGVRELLEDPARPGQGVWGARAPQYKGEVLGGGGAPLV